VTPARETPRGHLVLVVGPSGAGKDSLLEAARRDLAGLPQFVFPRRIITRESDPASEDHCTLSEQDFAARKAAGAFFLNWEAHGLCYALPGTVADDLAAGHTVIANVSRQVIDQARRRHPWTTVAFVTAPLEVLEARLMSRGREDADTVRRRLLRSVDQPAGVNVVTIVNDGLLETAVGAFLTLLKTPAPA